MLFKQCLISFKRCQTLFLGQNVRLKTAFEKPISLLLFPYSISFFITYFPFIVVRPTSLGTITIFNLQDKTDYKTRIYGKKFYSSDIGFTRSDQI